MGKPQFFCVVDFDELQHYKHRSPPWIKLYSRLWENPQFELLSDINKAHYLGICVLASRNNNRIPMDLSWIERHISATNPLDLNILFASKLLAPCKQNALSEKRQRQSREETEKKGKGTGEGATIVQSSANANGNGHRLPSNHNPYLKEDPEERAEAKREFDRQLAKTLKLKSFP